MKKKLVLCLCIASIILLYGCTPEEKTDGDLFDRNWRRASFGVLL